METIVDRSAKLQLETVEPSELAKIEGGWIIGVVILVELAVGGAVAGAAIHDCKNGQGVPTRPPTNFELLGLKPPKPLM
jgi:hypothetical protein